MIINFKCLFSSALLYDCDKGIHVSVIILRHLSVYTISYPFNALLSLNGAVFRINVVCVVDEPTYTDSVSDDEALVFAPYLVAVDMHAYHVNK